MRRQLPATAEEWRRVRLQGPGHTLEVEDVRESHHAWVLLSGSWVLKIRKPVCLGFLDYRSLSARRTAAAEELRLGLRASPHVYLGVWQLMPGSEFVLHSGVAEREDTEPVLAMVRLDDSLNAREIMARADSTPPRLDAAIRGCASFHLGLPADRTATGWDDGPMFRMRRAWEVNFEQMPVGAPNTPLLDAEREGLIVETAHWLKARTGVFQERVQLGRVRECHGDLRLEHVFLTDPWSVIDPLDFSSDLRWVDVASDICFLAMELDALGRRDARDYLLQQYAHLTDDQSLLTVAPFFLRYRAIVRAKVQWIRSCQLKGTIADEAKSEARRLAELAMGYELSA
jgi:uncharacterized protein